MPIYYFKWTDDILAQSMPGQSQSYHLVPLDNYITCDKQ